MGLFAPAPDDGTPTQKSFPAAAVNGRRTSSRRARTTTDGQVTLRWPAEAAGYGLEFTPVIGEAANWQPVTPAPAGNTFTTPFNQPLRFYRLQKP